ncbi:hypothetical protein CPB86DRAFT_107794 [Serendipita vermifera]|nr:hypothetical protein CPB86DRAFT_107794 [Serendipita vermifera]
MSIRLLFANNSVKNTTLKCDSLGIQYDVSEKDGIVSVARWDSTMDKNIPVGQFNLSRLGKDQIKLANDEEWRLLKEVIYKSKGGWWLSSFVATDGSVYQWKLQWKGVIPRLVMCYEDPKRGTEPLVKYVLHPKSSKDPSYLEVVDSSLLSSIDLIVVTFLIMETKKRELEKISSN